MSIKSSSGVQGLRAMFEQGNTETSPPSRSRSPAGDSTTSTPSRPVSKVRTSFISVDKGGVGLLPELRKTSTNESRPSMDGAQDEKPLNGSLDGPKINGEKKVPAIPTSDPFTDEIRSTPKNKISSLSDPAARRTVEPGQESTGNPDKPVMAGEEAPSDLLPGDPTSSEAVSGGSALGSDAQDLGMILKGSPFLEEPREKSSIQEGQKHPSAKPALTTQPKHMAPKVGTNEKPKGNPKDPSPPSKTKTVSKPSVEKPVNGISRSNPEKALKSPGTPWSPKPLSSSAQEPKPKLAATHQPTSTAPKPKPKLDNSQPATKRVPEKPAEKTATKPPTRTSLASSRSLKPTSSGNTAKPAASANTTSTKPAPAPSNPKSSTIMTNPSKPPFTKPHPKSPTRPVRLPASATAPTAASAAKLDNNDVKGPVPVAASRPKPTSSTQKKPPRASLPARSAPMPDRPARSQPRASMVSTTSSRPGDDGFLARMMRPTQASKSKTHDKVEVKSPPRAAAMKPAAKPKRISEGSEKENEKEKKKDGEAVDGEATTGDEVVSSQRYSTATVEEEKNEKVQQDVNEPLVPKANNSPELQQSVAATTQ